MRLTSLALALAGVALSAMTAMAQTAIKPAIVYDMGGKFDKSFNEGAFNGAEKFKKARPASSTATSSRTERRPARAGAAAISPATAMSPIIAIGFSAGGGAGGRSRRSSPTLKFAIIDMVVDLPNVQSLDPVQGA
jgi:basic membrane protein A